MSKLTKNQKLAAGKVEVGKNYSLAEAAQLVKDITFTKFDASVDIDVRLGVDPRKSNQMVRGVVSLPNGTGKTVRVLALCTPDKEAEAKAAGADYVGLDEFIEKMYKLNDPTSDEIVSSTMSGNYGETEFYFYAKTEPVTIKIYDVTYEERELIKRNMNKVTSEMLKEALLNLYREDE